MKVLVAIDGSVHSARAIETVATLAPKLGAEVVVLHCHERELVGRAGLIDFETPQEISELTAKAVGRLREAGVQVDARVEVVHFGQVARSIVDVADEIGADLIAMGTRGESDLEAMLVGGIAHKVIHLSKRPVLVVP
jgi:nucleotide-binding universal stress UspA family protein